jgi:hypothetical protein
MAGRYLPFFSITCSNSYFADGLCHPLQLQPDDACQQLLNLYRLMFRPAAQGGGGTVYYSDAAILQRFNSLAGLGFDLQCSDMSLLNYSQINTAPLSQHGSGPSLANSLFYADNLGATASSIAAAQGTNLSNAENMVLQPAFGDSALQTQSMQFLYTFASPVTSARLTVTDNLSGQVVWQATTPDTSVPSYLITLTALPQGRYQLLVNDELAQTFYTLARPMARPWGKITIYLGGAAQIPYLEQHGNTTWSLGGDGTIMPINYQLALSHRQTIWRYRIFSSQTTYGANWQVNAALSKSASTQAEQNTGNTPFTFHYMPGPVEPPWVYQSAVSAEGGLDGQLLNLLHTPRGMSFTLAPVPSNLTNPSVKLPYAQGGLLVIPDADDPALNYSDIYVYL